jgi:hypothetical protein
VEEGHNVSLFFFNFGLGCCAIKKVKKQEEPIPNETISICSIVPACTDKLREPARVLGRLSHAIQGQGERAQNFDRNTLTKETTRKRNSWIG